MKIIAKNLSKRFHREWIFKDFNFEFTAPETYAILGPNGSGKSTLIQLLWGQMVPSSGQIFYESEGRAIPTYDMFRHVAIATPYMDLIEEFTLGEMVTFHFRFKTVRQGKSTDELLEIFELSHAKDKLIYNFSSGMRQRLKLGLAFYSQCSALFLDEPTTHLDGKSMDWYWRGLNDLRKNTMVIIASNQPDEYPADAKKIDILNYKRVTNWQRNPI
jgi:ABC-type multidrug transport system ATPase subunit